MSKVSCMGCGATYRVDERHTGRTLKCKKCGGAVKVPDNIDESAELGADAGFDPFKEALSQTIADQAEKQAAIEESVGQLQGAPPTRTRLKEKMPSVSLPFNAYRLLRFVIGIVMVGGGAAIMYAAYMAFTAEPRPGVESWKPLSRNILYVVAALTLLGVGLAVALASTSNAERDTRLFARSNKSKTIGIFIFAVVLLTLNLNGATTGPVNIATLAAVLTGGVMIFKSVKRYREERVGGGFQPESTDMFALAALLILVSAPFGIQRLNSAIEDTTNRRTAPSSNEYNATNQDKSHNTNTNITLGVRGHITFNGKRIDFVDGYAQWATKNDFENVSVDLVSRNITAEELVKIKGFDIFVDSLVPGSKSANFFVSLKEAATTLNPSGIDNLFRWILRSDDLVPNERLKMQRISSIHPETGVDDFFVDRERGVIAFKLNIKEQSKEGEKLDIKLEFHLPIHAGKIE